MRILRFCFAVLLSIAYFGETAIAASTAPVIEPPFVRRWTVMASVDCAVIAVRDGLVFYRSMDGIGAVELATGKVRWNALGGRWIVAATLSEQSIYAITWNGRSAELVAISLPGHQSRILGRWGTDTREIAVDSRRVYVFSEEGAVRAYDRASGAIAWTRRLGADGYPDKLCLTTGALYAAVQGSGEFGLDPGTGKVLWHQAGDVGSEDVLPVGGDFITQRSEL